MSEMDPDWRRGAEALQKQITAANRRYYTPRGAVTAQIYNSIGQQLVVLCVADLNPLGTGESATGTLLLYTEKTVSIVSLEDAPSVGAAARWAWALRVRVLPRSALRRVDVLSDHLAGDVVEAAGFQRLAMGTRVRLTYADCEPLEIEGQNVKDVEAFLSLALSDLERAS